MKKEVLLDYNCIDCNLAAPVYSKSGTKIVGEETILSEKIISRLKSMGIETIFIYSEGDDIEEFDCISPLLKNSLLKELELNYQSLTNGNKLNIVCYKNLINEIIKELYNPKIELKYQLLEYKDFSIAAHSVNVAMLSLLIGKILGYNKQKLEDLGLGALLHDVGNVVYFENHCLEGFKYLKTYQELKATSYIVALQHHGINEKDVSMHEHSQIVYLASLFDDYLNKDKLEISKAISKTIYNCNGVINKEILKIFINLVTIKEKELF